MNTARQLTFDLAHRTALSGEDFLVAPANAEAVAWIDKWPDWPGSTICISGPTGCGKTHLANVFMAKTQAHNLQAHLIDASDINENNARSLVESHAALVIDNAHQIANSDREEALFHILNMLNETGHHAILCAQTPPARWKVQLPDLQSRLNALQHVPIQNPDEALLAAVMVKQFSDRQLRIDTAGIDYILPRMERSFSAVNTIVSAIDTLALREHRNITIPLIKKVMDAHFQEELKL